MILDTNALSAWAEGTPECRSAFLAATRLVVPVVVLGESLFGIRQSKFRKQSTFWAEAQKLLPYLIERPPRAPRIKLRDERG